MNSNVQPLSLSFAFGVLLETAASRKHSSVKFYTNRSCANASFRNILKFADWTSSNTDRWVTNAKTRILWSMALVNQQGVGRESNVNSKWMKRKSNKEFLTSWNGSSKVSKIWWNSIFMLVNLFDLYTYVVAYGFLYSKTASFKLSRWPVRFAHLFILQLNTFSSSLESSSYCENCPMIS